MNLRKESTSELQELASLISERQKNVDLKTTTEEEIKKQNREITESLINIINKNVIKNKAYFYVAIGNFQTEVKIPLKSKKDKPFYYSFNIKGINYYNINDFRNIQTLINKLKVYSRLLNILKIKNKNFNFIPDIDGMKNSNVIIDGRTAYY